jgi:hypothetical protein
VEITDQPMPIGGKITERGREKERKCERKMKVER